MDEQLLRMAEGYFRTMRTPCSFVQMFQPQQKDGYYIFTALFRCKNGRGTVKVIRMRPDGTVVKGKSV